PALHHGLVEVSCTCRLPTVTAAYSVTMPSSPPSVRPVLAALLTVLLLTASALVSGPATLVPAARAENPAPAPQAPSAPPDGDADTPVSMDLVSLTPTSLDPGGTLEAQIAATTTSSEPVSEPGLALRTRTARATDGAALPEGQSGASAQPRGEPLAASDPHPQPAPGESVRLTPRVEAEEPAYSEEPYVWATGRLEAGVAGGEGP